MSKIEKEFYEFKEMVALRQAKEQKLLDYLVEAVEELEKRIEELEDDS